ncbi:MAG: hypothetical protein HYS86_02385 [Candidatus Chisholmbacteria bacterium]|nr:hypothetical protein [Candidatus Chisholmbacteria bacterium]
MKAAPLKGAAEAERKAGTDHREFRKERQRADPATAGEDLPPAEAKLSDRLSTGALSFVNFFGHAKKLTFSAFLNVTFS